jgi:hypothetical protein
MRCSKRRPGKPGAHQTPLSEPSIMIHMQSSGSIGSHSLRVLHDCLSIYLIDIDVVQGVQCTRSICTEEKIYFAT